MQLPEYCSSFGHQPGGAVSGIHRSKYASHSNFAFSIRRYKDFKDFKTRICVSTDVFGRGIDVERINVAINYDMPLAADQYLHRVGRAGRFGTKGLSISFVSTKEDEAVLADIEKRFEVALP